MNPDVSFMVPNPNLSFRALADPIRRNILHLQAQGERTIGAVVQQFYITRCAVKNHLRVLEDAQFIIVTPQGRKPINRLNPDGFRSVSTG
jgi:DNA-binding transcriptional ArsR family regulator